ncbi:hypothetical protein N9L19_01175 [bacterium]|nr:hypothetical protein [bacterium]
MVEYCNHIDQKIPQLFLLAKQLRGFKGRLGKSLAQAPVHMEPRATLPRRWHTTWTWTLTISFLLERKCALAWSCASGAALAVTVAQKLLLLGERKDAQSAVNTLTNGKPLFLFETNELVLQLKDSTLSYSACPSPSS